MLTHDWIATAATATALGTTTLAVVNYILLREQKSALTREINEKIYSNLHRDLSSFLNPATHTPGWDLRRRIPEFYWSWEYLKLQQFHLAYRVPRKIIEKLEAFSPILKSYQTKLEGFSKHLESELIGRAHAIKPQPNLDEVSLTAIECRVYSESGRSGHPFEIFNSLFLQQSLQENLRICRENKKAYGAVKCEFIDGGSKIFVIEGDEAVLQFFENLFKDLQQSILFQELQKIRSEGTKLAEQILKKISPK